MSNNVCRVCMIPAIVLEFPHTERKSIFMYSSRAFKGMAKLYDLVGICFEVYFEMKVKKKNPYFDFLPRDDQLAQKASLTKSLYSPTDVCQCSIAN